MKKIAITGIGVVSPSGIGKRQFWANIKSGRSFIKEITRFDAGLYPSHIAGQIDDLEKYSHISERLLKKIDTFSHLALVAAELALQDAAIDVKSED
ncbi:MAG: beta-ketoacyl synthase N-terminal-like domain-containing protein, partial [Candidatus Omnitrophota bacterium]